MSPAALMVSFLSMELNPNNHLIMTRVSTCASSVLSILNWTQLCPQHFSLFLSTVNILISPGFQEWHMNLLTSVCVHPVSTKAVHFLIFTSMSVIGSASFFVSLESKLMLMTSSPRHFLDTQEQHAQSCIGNIISFSVTVVVS